VVRDRPGGHGLPEPGGGTGLQNIRA